MDAATQFADKILNDNTQKQFQQIIYALTP